MLYKRCRMIIKIYRLIKELINELCPVKLKTWICDEFIPLVVIYTCIFFHAAIVFQPLLIVYTCRKSSAWILFWLGHFLWIIYDSNTEKTMGRKIHWMLRLGIYKYVPRYFPSRLIKLADLPPDKNYILATYPHGAVPLGSYFSLGTSANNVEDLFPNIDIRPVTVNPWFYGFLGREFLLASGMCKTDKKSLLCVLKSAPSKALLLYPGGFQDVLHSRSGNVYTITNRKGFIRVALESGAALVPVFSFGENNSFDIIQFTWPPIVAFNKLYHKYFGGEIIIPKGRGGIGSFLPRRRPITTVVGKPIKVPKVENPSAELVDEYHEKYFKALYNLFEEHKGEFDEAGNAAQLIVK